MLSGPVKSIPASNVSKHRYGGVHRLTLLGNNSIMSGTAPSGLCHGLPGKVRENHRVIDEPGINHRLCQYPPPSLRLPHHASSNNYHGDKCWGPRRLPVSGQEYYYSRRPLLLGLYKPGLIVGGAYVQVRQAPLPPRQGQASARSGSRPELGLETRLKVQKTEWSSFSFQISAWRSFSAPSRWTHKHGSCDT